MTEKKIAKLFQIDLETNSDWSNKYLLYTCRRIEYSESSSDSDTEETRNINLEVPQEDDRELSSLRDGLRIDDMSSIHAISGILWNLLN